MKNSFFGIIIIILIIIAATQRGCLGTSDSHKGPDTVRVIDTTWIRHDSVIVKKVPILQEIPADTQYLPQIPADYESLKAAYANLQGIHYAKRVYQDSIAVGTFGYIHVTDTVNQNTLGLRKTRDDFNIPVVKETTTITKYDPPKRQVYIGGGLNATTQGNVLGAEAGLLYKTRNDKLFGATFNVGVNGTTSFGLHYYSKIQLKKK